MGKMSEIAAEQAAAAGPEQDMQKIITAHVFPPIPWRHFDWQAYYDGDEPDDDGGMCVGHGATEQEAIDDLVDTFPRQGEGQCPDCFFMTPFGKAHCASCEGTGIQLITEGCGATDCVNACDGGLGWVHCPNAINKRRYEGGRKPLPPTSTPTV